MTLEENVQQLRDPLTVTSAITLRHETRLKEHQTWQEDMEVAFARMAARDEIHSAKMIEFDEKMTQIAAAQLLTEERLAALWNKLDGFIDALRRGGNGHQ
jgi:hypothetical protein